MRVIAGTAKRLQLKTPKGLNTRPTTDRIKETLFNMIATEIPGCRFLDLFSGSGAMGIEALSRGAREAVFIENDKSALNCLKENLEHTGLASKAVVVPKDVMVGLMTLTRDDVVKKQSEKVKEKKEETKEKIEKKVSVEDEAREEKRHIFNLIYMDPPYEQGLEKKVLEYLAKSSIINSETLIIVEAGRDTSFDYLEELGFYIVKEKEYKSNRHMFLSLKNQAEGSHFING